jgi:hypothetical protein
VTGTLQQGVPSLPRTRRLPPWAVVLLLYAATRAWSWFVLITVARHQGASPWGGARPGYLEFIGFWDSDWYRQIAEGGYPSELPASPSGETLPNAWAFYPLYPAIVRAVMGITGLSWNAAGGAVSLACGAGASLLLYRLFRREDGGAGLDRFALTCTALVLLNPVAPVLQVPYAESLSLLLLAGVLLAVLRGRLKIAAALVLLACLSRPIGVPLGAMLGIWWCVRAVAAYRQEAAGGDVVPRSRQRRALNALRRTRGPLALALWACACALGWVFAAWAVTGRPDAYTAAETAWRGEHLLPFQPWLEQSLAYLGPLGPLVLVVLVGGFVLALRSRAAVASLPARLRLWCACYLVYLLAFLFPQTSTFRLLLPLFPLAAPLAAASRSRAYRALLLVGAALGQLIWVGWLWHWQELPGGGDYPP